MTLISFVIPCYRSENTISMVVDEIINTVSERSEYDYEIICVNDCSPDNVYSKLEKMATGNTKIKVINFAKNMGKHAAVLAGHSVVNGKYVVDMDDDFQSPVNQLWRLLEPIENDECDYSTAEYREKKESRFKRFGSDVNSVMSHIMLDKPKGIRMETFSIMKRFVSDEIIKYKNPYPYMEGLVLRTTRRIKTVEMEQRERGDDNKSGFTFKKSLQLWINGMTAFSVKPLRIATFMGFGAALMGFVYGIVIVVQKLVGDILVLGYSSLLAMILFIGGLIMLMLGLLGEYIGRIYICLNASPQYVIRNTINIGSDNQPN